MGGLKMGEIGGRSGGGRNGPIRHVEDQLAGIDDLLECSDAGHPPVDADLDGLSHFGMAAVGGNGVAHFDDDGHLLMK
jgi:hypothetical protein